MGLIADLAAGRKDVPARDAREAWRQVFGTSKETPHEAPKTRPGGSWGRGIISEGAAFKRLLQAMRSMAPGGWSDDRYEQSRHYTGIVYTAIHRCGEQMSQAEFQVFEKDEREPDGKRPIAKGHPGYALIKLLEKPNDDDSFGELMYNWNLQMDLTGTALTWMVPNKLGTPFELYPIPTAIAVPQPAINPDYPDGYYRIQPLYPYGPFSSYPTPTTAVGAPIPAQWMLRFKYAHPLLRYEGYSPMTAMRLHIDEVESMDRSRWYAMKRSVNPSAVLNFDEMEGAQPLPESEIERIHTEWENEFQGPENTGKLIVGTPGGRVDPWGSNPIDMDYQSGWEQLTSFVQGGGFGITKPAAGMVEDASYSTLFATLKQLYWLTLEPKCNRIAAKLTRHLAPFFGDNLIVEIRCKRIDDHDLKFTKIDKLVSGKAITKAELRKELDMEPTNEPWANEIAGTESPPPGGQPGMPGAPGAAPGNGMPQMADQANAGMEPYQQQGTGEDEVPAEIEHARGRPGKLAEGALGPRMKNLRRLYKAASRNGRNGHAIANGRK